jgi:quercetin dioxygenase-like cupin family protein
LGQETDQEKRIFLVNTTSVPIEVLEKGAEKTQVQYLIDDRHGSDRFALRLYTVKKGGHTPLDQHPYEHHVYVMNGEGLLRQSKQPNAPLRPLKPGDSLFIPSNAIHQFSNGEDEPFTFLCVKGNPKLYVDPEQSVPDDSERNYC